MGQCAGKCDVDPLFSVARTPMLLCKTLNRRASVRHRPAGSACGAPPQDVPRDAPQQEHRGQTKRHGNHLAVCETEPDNAIQPVDCAQRKLVGNDSGANILADELRRLICKIKGAVVDMSANLRRHFHLFAGNHRV